MYTHSWWKVAVMKIIQMVKTKCMLAEYYSLNFVITVVGMFMILMKVTGEREILCFRSNWRTSCRRVIDWCLQRHWISVSPSFASGVNFLSSIISITRSKTGKFALLALFDTIALSCSSVLDLLCLQSRSALSSSPCEKWCWPTSRQRETYLKYRKKILNSFHIPEYFLSKFFY